MTSTPYMRRPLLLLPLLLALASCQLLPWPPPEATQKAPEQPEIKGPHVPTAQELEIKQLLADAAQALADDRLTTPPDDCAYFRYLRVLTLDPNNTAGRIGMSDIVERYLTWALLAADSRRFAEAARYIENARDVDSGHPNITAVANQIDDLEHSATIRYRLPPEGIEARNADTAQLLRWIAVEIAQLEATVVITARTDAEGRWIYQQINEATTNRISAELQIGTPPSIELLSPPS